MLVSSDNELVSTVVGEAVKKKEKRRMFLLEITNRQLSSCKKEQTPGNKRQGLLNR